MLALLTRLQRERNMALMLITHDLALVAETAHRVVVMYAGQEVETGPVPGAFETPRHPYTQALLAALPEHNEDNARLKSIPGMVPGQHDRPTGCLLSPRCAYAVERCRRDMPPIAGVAGRRVRCHFPLDSRDAHQRLATRDRGARGSWHERRRAAQGANSSPWGQRAQRAWGSIERHAARSARVDAALPRVARDVPAQGPRARARRRLVHVARRRDARDRRRIRLRQVDARAAGDDDRTPDLGPVAAGRSRRRHGGCRAAPPPAAARADGLPESVRVAQSAQEGGDAADGAARDQRGAVVGGATGSRARP